MERQAAQTGAGTQQAAAGQAATLEAQQALSEQQAAAGIGAQQIAQGQGATTALNTAQQNEQGILKMQTPRRIMPPYRNSQISTM